MGRAGEALKGVRMGLGKLTGNNEGCRDSLSGRGGRGEGVR